jgi:hypothetical protein
MLFSAFFQGAVKSSNLGAAAAAAAEYCWNISALLPESK